MNHSKENENNYTKKSFETKLDPSTGKPNLHYVDLLEEDKPIAGQKFVCVSFVSPDKIIKQKEIYLFEQFLNKWDLNKSMEKFVQFLNFISFKLTTSSQLGYFLRFNRICKGRKRNFK